MTSKRRTIAVVVMMDVLLLGTFFSVSAYAGPTADQTSADSALRQAQKSILDPHADVGDHPELTDPHHHVGRPAALPSAGHD
ncbi:MAG TPA: hypothetical protein VFP34_14935, partial [Microlunatus sp.]|nr:hypothetical protein [Microlunatus sp.]